ncbi:ferredoxin [Streptomyces sp. NPDC058268]|uniref:ferredoxin n=1 Tax=Streptomyces sp. NPDC058268 TaxID=3346413 RepID=UPI0036E4145D
MTENAEANAEEEQMDVRVDRHRCAGSGLCMAQVPAVFDQSDEDGKVLLNVPAPGSELAGAVRRAAARCPSGAITLHESGHGPEHASEDESEPGPEHDLERAHDTAGH